MIYLNLGRRGNGKTTLGAYIVGRIQRRVIFDPRGLVRTERGKGSIVATNGQQFDGAMELLESDEADEVIFTPADDVDVAFRRFCRAVQRYVQLNPDTPIGILIDEVRFMDIKNPALDWVLRCSPVDTVHIVFTGHRPKDVPPDIRAIADKWLLFQFTLPGDVKLIEEQTSPDVAVKVQRLAPRHFVEWDDARGVARFYTDPSRWYVPLRPARALVGVGPEGPDPLAEGGGTDRPADSSLDTKLRFE